MLPNGVKRPFSSQTGIQEMVWSFSVGDIKSIVELIFFCRLNGSLNSGMQDDHCDIHQNGSPRYRAPLLGGAHGGVGSEVERSR